MNSLLLIKFYSSGNCGQSSPPPPHIITWEEKNKTRMNEKKERKSTSPKGSEILSSSYISARIPQAELKMSEV